MATKCFFRDAWFFPPSRVCVCVFRVASFNFWLPLSPGAVNANFLWSLLRAFTVAIVQSAGGIIRGISEARLMERNERDTSPRYRAISGKYKERIYFSLKRARGRYSRTRYAARIMSSDIRIKIFALRWPDSPGGVY